LGVLSINNTEIEYGLTAHGIDADEQTIAHVLIDSSLAIPQLVIIYQSPSTVSRFQYLELAVSHLKHHTLCCTSVNIRSTYSHRHGDIYIYSTTASYHLFMFIVGRRAAASSSRVPATSLGMRLIRYAPVRIWCTWLCDMAEPLLRILPVSLIVSLFRNRGGAKSKAVKVLDFLS
jgi:hypothetical protein